MMYVHAAMTVRDSHCRRFMFAVALAFGAFSFLLIPVAHGQTVPSCTYPTPLPAGFANPCPVFTLRSPSPVLAASILPIVSFTIDRQNFVADNKDLFALAIRSTLPGEPVSILKWKNGIFYEETAYGSTDANGNWSRTGTFDDPLVGSWEEQARIGETLSEKINFIVVKAANSDSCTEPELSPWPSMNWSHPCPVFAANPALVLRTSGTLTLTVKPLPGISYIYHKAFLHAPEWNCEGKFGNWCPLTLPGTLVKNDQGIDTAYLNAPTTLALKSPTLSNLALGIHYLALWDWVWDADVRCYKGSDGVCSPNSNLYRLQSFTVNEVNAFETPTPVPQTTMRATWIFSLGNDGIATFFDQLADVSQCGPMSTRKALLLQLDAAFQQLRQQGVTDVIARILDSDWWWTKLAGGGFPYEPRIHPRPELAVAQELFVSLAAKHQMGVIFTIEPSADWPVTATSSNHISDLQHGYDFIHAAIEPTAFYGMDLMTSELEAVGLSDHAVRSFIGDPRIRGWLLSTEVKPEISSRTDSKTCYGDGSLGGNLPLNYGDYLETYWDYFANELVHRGGTDTSFASVYIAANPSDTQDTQKCRIGALKNIMVTKTRKPDMFGIEGYGDQNDPLSWNLISEQFRSLVGLATSYGAYEVAPQGIFMVEGGVYGTESAARAAYYSGLAQTGLQMHIGGMSFWQYWNEDFGRDSSSLSPYEQRTWSLVTPTYTVLCSRSFRSDVASGSFQVEIAGVPSSISEKSTGKAVFDAYRSYGL